MRGDWKLVAVVVVVETGLYRGCKATVKLRQTPRGKDLGRSVRSLVSPHPNIGHASPSYTIQFCHFYGRDVSQQAEWSWVVR